MAHTAATFKARFEEFTPLGDSVVSAALAEATRRTDARVLGDRFDDAVALRAADLLATGAFGLPARADAKENAGPSKYAQQLATLLRERAGGAWAAGIMSTGRFL